MPLKKMSKRTEELEEEEPEEEELDWWSKYYASLEEQALEVSIENQSWLVWMKTAKESMNFQTEEQVGTSEMRNVLMV